MNKTILITGANRGIGLALTKLYLQQNFRVIAVCRQTDKELTKTNATIIDHIELGNPKDISALANQLAGVSIDILINNAGILHNENLLDMNFDRMAEQISINALAPLRITHALLDNLSAGSKIAFISSRMGSIADNGSGAYYGYRMSKAALNAAGKSLANDLKPRGISVALLHPGLVSTRMIGFAGDITPEQAARSLAARIDALTLTNSGTFWHANGDVLPW